MSSSSNQTQTQSQSKRNKGRQKVDMVKMANQSNLQVTFSKRRAGLFKKASELCTLCGAEAAIVVFSPAEKPYCFGHPNAKTVLDRFVTAENTDHVDHNHHGPKPTNTTQLIMEAHRNSTIRELNLELTQVESMVRAERRRGEELEAVRKAGVMSRWFPGTFDKFNYEQLGVLKEAVIGFKNNFEDKLHNDINNVYNYALPVSYIAENPDSNPNPNPNPNCGGHFWPFGSMLPSDDFPRCGHDQSMGLSDGGALARNRGRDGFSQWG